jgi:preprotein translocase subunit SecB
MTTSPTIEADAPPVIIHAQYIRDLSFENPNAPESMRQGAKAPDLILNIGMDARQLPQEQVSGDLPNLFEVVLNVKAEATRDGAVVFIAEVLYGVLLSIDKRVPEDTHHPMLLIEIPRLAFPFVRQIMMDITVKGGFAPLMLSPVDFHALYMKQFAAQAEKSVAKA